MTSRTHSDDIKNLKEILMTNTIQIDTISRLLIEKGVFTRDEYLNTMRDVQTEYFNTGS